MSAHPVRPFNPEPESQSEVSSDTLSTLAIPSASHPTPAYPNAVRQYQHYQARHQPSQAEATQTLRHAHRAAQRHFPAAATKELVPTPTAGTHAEREYSAAILRPSFASHDSQPNPSLRAHREGAPKAEPQFLPAHASELPQAHATSFGQRLIATLFKKSIEHPEPLETHPKPPLQARLMRAVSAPASLVAAVAGITLLIAIATVMLQPHALPEAASTTQSALMKKNGAGDEAVAGAQKETAAAIAAEPASAKASVFVHVVGAVHTPGVIELPSGSRVSDAVALAGGATEAAVTAGVNLARIVNDGEQIVVPDATTSSDQVTAAPNPTTTQSTIVNLNSANEAELEVLPRVGPALAARIIEWRTENGAFGSVDQLTEVSGIGAKMLTSLRALVTV